MSIERPDEPYAVVDPLGDEPNEDRLLAGEVTEAPTQEESDVELEQDQDDYVPEGDGGPAEGSEGDVIEDDAGAVAPDPVPDPGAPSSGDDDPARSNVGESDG